jgi:branched-subunit amino acid transport protein
MLAVMAGATYLLRMLPFVLCKRKLTNRYLLSFLEYIPYTVLASMTVPAVFYSTGRHKSPPTQISQRPA